MTALVPPFTHETATARDRQSQIRGKTPGTAVIRTGFSLAYTLPAPLLQ
jgi:hypothetical protein